MNKESFLKNHRLDEKYLIENNINWKDLYEIHKDYQIYKPSYETQAELIANILRGNKSIHSVKSRVKDEYHLMEKVIRKTHDRRKKYGDNFNFTVDNYKDEITDLVGIRVIHIFKEDWEEIHKFVTNIWKVNEIVANVREGDNTKTFEELDIKVCSRLSGYRSVHYLIESYPTNKKIIAEIQVRTIFEEGYGEIDHQLRYSHKQIPEILEMNLMLLNRIAGSSDEMASVINMLNKSFDNINKECEEKIQKKNNDIEDIITKIQSDDDISNENKEKILGYMQNIKL